MQNYVQKDSLKQMLKNAFGRKKNSVFRHCLNKPFPVDVMSLRCEDVKRCVCIRLDLS